MRRLLMPALAAAGLSLAATAAAAPASALTLSFVDPEHYTDATYARAHGSERERLEVQRDLERHLRQLVERRLPTGRTLAVDVLDIDLAGHFEPFTFRSAADIRIVRDVTWPRLKLRYVLAEGDRVLARGEEAISDPAFMMSAGRYSGTDRLRYEKALLDDWFERRISRPRTPL